ncbi:homeodomain-interacting protein kinase 2-like [Centropristis striata]|uniref:homeodomain-interacting protein kinase 2-like n=1 Tax=Centropristis striata TaxID=184440 RepID=UPI0027E1D410|nr:homeodomain-interacting protein kinase 2-like [Centropristis striata]
MMVDHTKRPFRVKLIDFGLTMHRSKTKQGWTMQVVPYRALEIMLGLPFSEAIDMWSLGCVMAVLLYGKELFSADTEYEALHEITALLGVPPDHLLEKGRKTGKYFTKSECNTWRLKTHQEYWGGHANSHPQYQPKVHFSLDDLRRAHLTSIDECEDLRTGWAVDLLEAMLSLDEAKRITPSEILTHPFITSGIYSHLIKKKRKTQRTTQDQTEVPAGVILVRPAAAENRQLQDGPGGILPKEDLPAGGILKENIPAGGILKENIPVGVILVRPAAAENRLPQDGPGGILLEENIRLHKTYCVTVTDTGTTDMTARTTSPTDIPPGVILVRPAAAENTLQLDDEERADRLPVGLHKTFSVKVTDTGTTDMTAMTTSPTDIPPGVILVSPAAAENTLQLDDEERADRLPVGLYTTYSVKVPDRDTMDRVTTDRDKTDRTHDGARTQKKSEQKKKKKNCIRRLFSWMKKTFCPCCTATIHPYDQDN